MWTSGGIREAERVIREDVRSQDARRRSPSHEPLFPIKFPVPALEVLLPCTNAFSTGITEKRDHGEAKRREEELSTDEVRSILEAGRILRRYPEDTPFPSYLVLGWIDGPARLGTYEKGRPIHSVAADDDENEVTWIITFYEPDPEEWTDQFKWRTRWRSKENTWRV